MRESAQILAQRGDGPSGFVLSDKSAIILCDCLCAYSVVVILAVVILVMVVLIRFNVTFAVIGVKLPMMQGHKIAPSQQC